MIRIIMIIHYNHTGASDKEVTYADKELAYGEQNVRPLAELKPAYGGQ